MIGRLHSRHRAIEFKQFLATLDREVPAELDVHVVLDNNNTHKTPAIQKWLTAHPRFVLHFTPTSSSWLNLVERWFAELTTKKLRRGTHRSVRELNADIRAWIDLERRSQALRLDQDRRPDPRIHRHLLHPNQRITTLNHCSLFARVDRRLVAALDAPGDLPGRGMTAARGSLSASGFAARPGLRTHVGPRRYSLERLAAIIAPARLSTETRLERRGPLVATVAGTGRAWRKVTIRPRSSS